MSTNRRTSAKRRTINLKQLLKCVGLIVLAFYLSVTLIEQQRRINAHVYQTQVVKALIAEAELQNALLEERLARVETDEYIKRIARETLRLVMPGDRVYIDSARR